MKQRRLFIVLLVLSIVLLSVIRVAVLNSMSTDGIGLDKMQEDIEKYKKENTLIQEKILEMSSLTEVASKAAELGFVSSKSEIYLTTPLPLAKR